MVETGDQGTDILLLVYTTYLLVWNELFPNLKSEMKTSDLGSWTLGVTSIVWNSRDSLGKFRNAKFTLNPSAVPTPSLINTSRISAMSAFVASKALVMNSLAEHDKRTSMSICTACVSFLCYTHGFCPSVVCSQISCWSRTPTRGDYARWRNPASVQRTQAPRTSPLWPGMYLPVRLRWAPRARRWCNNCWPSRSTHLPCVPVTVKRRTYNVIRTRWYGPLLAWNVYVSERYNIIFLV